MPLAHDQSLKENHVADFEDLAEKTSEFRRNLIFVKTGGKFKFWRFFFFILFEISYVVVVFLMARSKIEGGETWRVQSLSTPQLIHNSLAELFGRPSPSPSLRTSPSPKISDFENTSDLDSACLFVYAFIYCKEVNISQKNSEI
jgi:hypothetical protein